MSFDCLQFLKFNVDSFKKYSYLPPLSSVWVIIYLSMMMQQISRFLAFSMYFQHQSSLFLYLQAKFQRVNGQLTFTKLLLVLSLTKNSSINWCRMRIGKMVNILRYAIFKKTSLYDIFLFTNLKEAHVKSLLLHFFLLPYADCYI